ncbi:ATP-binding protein [Pseudomonas sp. NBRC 100443]|uniref:ATP-binding protein n=1 Tax=Pseudomonas sp. NBRC 100443 TaxID=1113665 RepID=UPI0025568CF2|nr:ATP-binding protein [Pseudomonas sp. NBRC 100443]
MHRNYDSTSPIKFYVFSDRIEITNPGGLYGEVNQSNFPSRSSYRNPTIAEAMKSLGFVNRFGYGIIRAQSLLEKNDSRLAEFEIEENFVLARVFARTE